MFSFNCGFIFCVLFGSVEVIDFLVVIIFLVVDIVYFISYPVTINYPSGFWPMGGSSLLFWVT